MGKSLPTTTRLQEFARLVSSEKLQSLKQAKPISRSRMSSPETAKLKGAQLGSERVRLKMESSEGQNRMPLAQVVSDCAKRWFQDTLKEAKAGDITMQVLVGQMYFSGYGVSRDPQKVNPLNCVWLWKLYGNKKYAEVVKRFLLFDFNRKIQKIINYN